MLSLSGIIVIIRLGMSDIDISSVIVLCMIEVSCFFGMDIDVSLSFLNNGSDIAMEMILLSGSSMTVESGFAYPISFFIITPFCNHNITKYRKSQFSYHIKHYIRIHILSYMLVYLFVFGDLRVYNGVYLIYNDI